MPKIMSEAQFRSVAKTVEAATARTSAYVILKDGDMVGKVWWLRRGQDRSGIPGWKVLLWDWTPEGQPTIQGAQGYGMGQDMMTLLLSELSFGGVPFSDHEPGRAGSWEDQLRARGFKVWQVI